VVLSIDIPPASDTGRELLIGCGSNSAKKIRTHSDGDWGNLVTLDINPDHKPDVVWDLTQMPLPFQDSEFTEIHAYEVLEHIGSQGDYKTFFAQFSEFWRILKPEGVLVGTCPMWNSAWAWGDPSHTRTIQKEQFVFLDQQQYIMQVGKTAMSDFRYIYKADFAIEWLDESPGGTFAFVLRAIKPSRYRPQELR
jgi:hypothetical protein